MIYVIATIHLNDGHRDAFIQAFNDNVPHVLAEDGCIAYAPVVDTDARLEKQPPLRSNVVVVVEQWESVEHLHAHLAAPHMDTYRKNVTGMVDRVELQVMEPA